MAEYKIFTFEEAADRVGLSEEAHRRVRDRLKEGDSLADAVRRECSWPEGFLEQLKGRPLEEQMEYYRIVETECRSRTAYGEITKENCLRFGYALKDYPGLRGLIVEDGVLIGVRIRSAWDHYGDGAAALPYRDICTYYASDNNGSGSNDREDYAHLCCVAPEKETE